MWTTYVSGQRWIRLENSYVNTATISTISPVTDDDTEPFVSVGLNNGHSISISDPDPERLAKEIFDRIIGH